MLFPTSSQSWMGMLHTHGHRGPLSCFKTTRDTPKVSAFCSVRLVMLVWDPPMKITEFRVVFCSFLHHIRHGRPYCTPMAIGAPMEAPEWLGMPLRLLHFALSAFLVLECNPPIKIPFCRAVFCSSLPHLFKKWAYSTPTAIGAPMAAPKQSVIPLRLVRFALSFFWCKYANLSKRYLYVEQFFALSYLISV